MLKNEKQEIVARILALLSLLIEDKETSAPNPSNEESPRPVEMLTIKECVDAVKGISEYTIQKACTERKNPVHKDGTGRTRENTDSERSSFFVF